MATVRLWRRALGRVDVLDVEQYLRGVVHSEMPASWPAEALKAQAVAARTYTMRAIKAPRHGDRAADLCNTAQCQAWSELTYPSTDAAVLATAGETWDNPCQYVSLCGRLECPHCNGAGGYNGQVWLGRMCQYGAKRCAEQGMDYHAILRLYYGGAPASVIYVPAVAVPGTDWTRYPRPDSDTGAGVHGSANASFPLGDNDGLIPPMLAEMTAMGLRWVKLLDSDGSSYNACRMVLQAGMMPVVRLYRTQPYPGMLTVKQREAARALAGIGVRYFERGNEPNLDVEWQPDTWPGQDWNAWTDNTFKALATDWIGDADFLASLGAFVAVDALAPGGNYDDITFLLRWFAAARQLGASNLLRDRAWLSVHNAGLNHPADYPDDAVNQAEHPGQTIHTHYYVPGSPTGASNCIRKHEAVHQLALTALGFDLPVICTEGGWWVGSRQDNRYAELTVDEASRRQADTLRGMRTAPAWLLAQMPWLWFNRKGANLAPGFERDAWKRWPGYGSCPASEPPELPLIASLKASPCQRREVSAMPPTTTPPTPTTPAVTDADLAQGRAKLSDVNFFDKAAVAKGYQYWGVEWTSGANSLSLVGKLGTPDAYVLKVPTGQWDLAKVTVGKC